MLIYPEKTYLLESSNSHFKETGLELWYPTSTAWNPRGRGRSSKRPLNLGYFVAILAPPSSAWFPLLLL